MAENYESVVTRQEASILATNKVLRNTYMLLAITLLFSAVMAAVSMAINVPGWMPLACSITSLVLLWFVLPRTANSSAGIGVVFAVTGLLGFGLGPILNHYLNLQNGSDIVITAFGGTGATFIGLSAFALITKKDFSFLRGFLMAGFIVLIVASIAGIFLQMPTLHIAISAGFILFSSAAILYQTGEIVNGGETNYVIATATLYVSIYNIFVSLLHILGMSDD